MIVHARCANCGQIIEVDIDAEDPICSKCGGLPYRTLLVPNDTLMAQAMDALMESYKRASQAHLN